MKRVCFWGVFVVSCLAACFIGNAIRATPAPPPPRVEYIYVEWCTGCGSCWHGDNEPDGPMKHCPLCPLTAPEYEDLINELRRNHL